jgi:hypothetical protein
MPMSKILLSFSALALCAAVVTAAGSTTVSARMGGAQTFRATQGLTYAIGSKRAVGFFQTVAGKCQLTLMIAEAVDPDVAQPPSAARMILAMSPGQSLALGSAEGETMTATCGAGAETLEVIRNSTARS